MEIPQRMAVITSSLVFAGAATLTMGAAAPASAASANTAATNAVTNAVTNTASAVLPTSWCSRHPWRCHDDFRHSDFDDFGFIGDSDDFDDFGGGFGDFGGGIDISNENINISSSGQFGF